MLLEGDAHRIRVVPPAPRRSLDVSEEEGQHARPSGGGGIGLANIHAGKLQLQVVTRTGMVRCHTAMLKVVLQEPNDKVILVPGVAMTTSTPLRMTWS